MSEINNRNIITLLAEVCTLYNDILFFSSKEINMIYTININNRKVEIIGNIPDEGLFEERLCGNLVRWNDDIICVPCNAKKIWIYNVKTCKWTGIKIEKSSLNYKFFNAEVWENKLFMFGYYYPMIICLDLVTHEVFYISYNRNVSPGVDGFFYGNSTIKGEHIYVASCNSNEVLKLNVKSLEYEFITIGNKENRYVGVTYDGKDFWLAPRRNTPIVQWSENGKFKEYPLPDSFLEDKCYFEAIIALENCLILPAIYENCTLIYDKIWRVLDNKSIFMCAKKIDSYIILITHDGTVSIIDDKLGEQKRYFQHISLEYLKEFINKKRDDYFNGDLVKETSFLSLDVFINAIVGTTTILDAETK